MPGWENRRSSGGNYDQNMAVPGVVYILENEGLRSGFVKIGCTRHSGDHRARNLNDDARTGMPGTFKCVFEVRTQDCGLAERLVFVELANHRRGKWGQEFFEVELAHAREVIQRVCSEVDEAVALRPPPPPPAPSPVMSPPPWDRPVKPPVSDGSRGSLRWLLMFLLVGGAIWAWGRWSPTLSQRLVAFFAPTAQHSASVQAMPVKKSGPVKAARPMAANLSADERASLDAACSNEKRSGEAAAIEKCQQRLLDKLASAPPPVDLSGLTALERMSMNSACSHDRDTLGPAALRACLDRQVTRLKEAPDHVDVSRLSRDVRMSVDAACSYAKHTFGPVDYYQCVSDQLSKMGVTSP